MGRPALFNIEPETDEGVTKEKQTIFTRVPRIESVARVQCAIH